MPKGSSLGTHPAISLSLPFGPAVPPHHRLPASRLPPPPVFSLGPAPRALPRLQAGCCNAHGLWLGWGAPAGGVPRLTGVGPGSLAATDLWPGRLPALAERATACPQSLCSPRHPWFCSQAPNTWALTLPSGPPGPTAWASLLPLRGAAAPPSLLLQAPHAFHTQLKCQPLGCRPRLPSSVTMSDSTLGP